MELSLDAVSVFSANSVSVCGAAVGMDSGLGLPKINVSIVALVCSNPIAILYKDAYLIFLIISIEACSRAWLSIAAKGFLASFFKSSNSFDGIPLIKIVLNSNQERILLGSICCFTALYACFCTSEAVLTVFSNAASLVSKIVFSSFASAIAVV